MMTTKQIQNKHTKGPWEALYVTNALDGKLADDYDVDIYGNDQPNDAGLLVAKLPVKDQNDIVICKDEVKANAQLIAAAPDLLESLNKVMTLIESIAWTHECKNNPIDNKKALKIASAAYKAINKANGKTIYDN